MQGHGISGKRTDVFDLQEQKKFITDFFISYITECAHRRIAMIENGELDDIMTAIKGEISMASMENRIDLAQDLCNKFEELASIEVEIERWHTRDYERNYRKS